MAAAGLLGLAALWAMYGFRLHACPDGSDGFNRAMADGSAEHYVQFARSYDEAEKAKAMADYAAENAAKEAEHGSLEGYAEFRAEKARQQTLQWKADATDWANFVTVTNKTVKRGEIFER